MKRVPMERVHMLAPLPNGKHVLHVRTMGERAAGILAGTRILLATAVFTRSMYACGEEGELVCLVREDLEAGPLNLLCGNWPDDLSLLAAPGNALTRDAAGGWVGRRLALNVDDASIWRPPPWPCFNPEIKAAGLARLPAVVARCAPEDSMARLLVDSPEKEAAASPLRAALMSEMKFRAKEFLRWLNEPGFPADERVYSLLGLGVGLTPSGDDVIAGALLALRAIGKDERADAVMAGLASRRTNPISHAHLLMAAKGECAAALHSFLMDLLSGGVHLEALAPRLAKVGHTSGWDAVFGMALALDNGVYAKL